MSNRGRWWLVAICALLFIPFGLRLLGEHRSRVLGALPLLFLVFCPLLHLVSHGRSHGGPDRGGATHAH